MTRIAVFDLDGTLVDSVPNIQAALNRLMAGLGRPGFDRAEAMGMIGDGVRVLVTRALTARGLTFEEAALARFEADYTAHAAGLTAPFPGIETMLTELTAEGWLLALCTNKPMAATRALLAGLGWQDRFAAIAGGDSFPSRKPDPAHLTATLGLLPAGRAVMIGDHRNDIAAAQGAGVPGVFVGWGYGAAGMAAGASAIAETQAALPAILRHLIG